jgi:cell wall-associated NlpC family hydrolase
MKPLLRLLLALALVAPATAQERTHVVRPGDSLAKLMFAYGVSGDAILRANGLHSTALPVGKRLVIPSASPAAPAEAPRAQPVSVARAESVPAPVAEPASPPAPEPDAAEPDAPSAPLVESAPPVPVHDVAPGDFAAAIAIPAGENIRYNGRWVPPGENSAWVMDCSNTTRWLYRQVRGLDLPRTASDQYEWLRARHRLWRVNPNSRSLQRRLEPGDLLFWEDTYKPVRRPPVTHVMLYLGTDSHGRMMMAGSQGASGPDTYEFTPGKRMGGYRFFFFFRRDGRFVAYGRP